MKVITVRQPWAWALVYGEKDIENRSRNIAGQYRGPIAIHAGKGWDPEAWRSYGQLKMTSSAQYLDYGFIIGVADLVDVHGWAGCATQHADLSMCSPWALSNSMHLVFRNRRPLEVPLRWKGALGLRELPTGVERDVLRRVASRTSVNVGNASDDIGDTE